MKDYEYFGKYANMPLNRRFQIISMAQIGMVTWNDVFFLLRSDDLACKAIGQKYLDLINEHNYGKLMDKALEEEMKKAHDKNKGLKEDARV